MVANLRPVKDVPLFLRAAVLVSKQFNDSFFLIAGSGRQMGELRGLAASLGLKDRVIFTEGRGRVIDYLSRMSIGCMTSLSEGFSNAILEYMAVGLPVVATDVGGNRESIVDGETGYLVRDRTPEAVAKPIIMLLGDDALRRDTGLKALARCATHFELGRTILDLENYYVRIADGGNGNGARTEVIRAASNACSDSAGIRSKTL
jgi:glycosyltransferase involved in cell wall biosynthesis